MIDPRDGTPESFEKQAQALNVGPEIVRRLLSAIVARGIHDPDVWVNSLQIPLRLTRAVGHLPRLALDDLRHLAPRRIPEAPVPHP